MVTARIRTTLLVAGLLLATLGVGLPAAGATTLAPDVVRIAGTSREGTAIALAQTAYPSGAATVVLARSDAYADALAGAPLAAALDAPVLLTPSASLAAPVAGEIDRLGADHAVLLGGEGALHPAVADALIDRGLSVERIGGASRFATAANIAGRVRELAVDPLTPVGAYLVEGAHADPNRGWPDAVAAAALAAQLRAPILLTTADDLPADTADAIADFTADGLAGVTIVGGTASVSGSVEADALRLNPVVDRVRGANRYATSVAVAERHLDDVDATTFLLASGGNWPDALVAGPAAAAMQAPLLLTAPDALPDEVAGLLAGRAPAAVGVVGGRGAVGDAVLDGIRQVVPPVAAEAFPSAAAGDDVTVPAGTTVVLDGQTPALGRVTVDGTLRLRGGAVLDAESMAVHGRLLAGTPLAPETGRVRIRLRGDEALADRPGTGTGGLEIHGGTVSLVGASRPTAWTRLSETAGAGGRTLLVDQPTGWRQGDRLVVTSSAVDHTRTEQVVVDSVDGRIVRLREPLAHDHAAVTQAVDGVEVRQAAEVGLLSRSVVVEGHGTGGHVMAMRSDHEHATARARAGGSTQDPPPHVHDSGAPPTVLLRGVRLHGLGQTGVLGRYPFHMHMLGAAPAVRLDTVAVTASGNRCVTVHGTRRTTVSRLIGVDTLGHCVFFEDGAETGNLVTQSLVTGYRPPEEADRLVDTDKAPAGFWVQHPSNTLIGNSAAGGLGHGVWLDLPSHPTGPSETREIDNRTAPLGVFDRNVAHSHGSTEFRSGTGLRVDSYDPPGTVHLADWDLWGNAGFGAWLESSTEVTLTDARVAGNRTGVQLHGASLTDAVVVGASANPDTEQKADRGVGLYHGGGIVDGVTFAHFTAEEHWREPAAVADGTHSHQFLSRVRDVTLIDTPRPLRLSESSSEHPRHIGVVDEDGSLTGTPGTYVSHGTMADRTCDPAGGGIAGLRCEGTDPVTAGFFVVDHVDESPLGPATFRDSHGQSAPALGGDGHKTEAVLGPGTYDLETARALSEKVEAVLFGRQDIDLEVTIPWTHDDVFVYHGWGEWADPVDVASGLTAPAEGWWHDDVGDTLRMPLDARLEDDRNSYWDRWMVCGVEYCGDGTGSKRS